MGGAAAVPGILDGGPQEGEGSQQCSALPIKNSPAGSSRRPSGGEPCDFASQAGGNRLQGTILAVERDSDRQPADSLRYSSSS